MCGLPPTNVVVCDEMCKLLKAVAEKIAPEEAYKRRNAV
jgi:hypothetical protein